MYLILCIAEKMAYLSHIILWECRILEIKNQYLIAIINFLYTIALRSQISGIYFFIKTKKRDNVSLLEKI